MRYRVHGVSRSTGAEAILVVEAKDHEAAAAVALRHLIVKRVEPEGGLAEPEAFVPPAKEGLDDLASAVQSQATGGADAPNRAAARPWRWLVAVACLVAVVLIALVVMWSRKR